MKYFSVVILLLLCSFFPALQQPEKTESTFIPKPYIFPQFGREWKNVPQGECFTDTLYPVGWSRDGKFAYILRSTDPVQGTGFWNFVVFDVVSDTFLMDSYYSDLELKIRTIDDVFLLHHGSDTIKKMEGRWSIVPTNVFQFCLFPAKPGKKTPSVEHVIVRDSIKSPPYTSQFISSASIFLVPLKKEKRMLWQSNFEKPSHFTELEALGYFDCPYGDFNVAFCGIAKAEGEFAYSRVKSLFALSMTPRK